MNQCEVCGFRCEGCGSSSQVKAVSSCTAYYWDGTGENPNKDRYLCPACADEHFAYWEEMWNEYYQGLL